MKRNAAFLMTIILMVSFSNGVKAQSKFGEDSVGCRKNISLFRDAVKKKNYEEAYPFWKAVLDSCPMSTKNVFINGVPILEYKISMAEKANDTALKSRYVQDLFDLFELRKSYYPEDEGYCMGQVGLYTMKFRAYNYEQAYEMLKNSVALCGAATSPQVLNVYFLTSERYMNNKRLGTDIVINAYDDVTEVLDAVMEVSEDDFQKVMDKIYALREQLDSHKIGQDVYDAWYEDFAVDSAKTYSKYNSYLKVSNNIDRGFSKYGTCENLIDIYGKKLEQNDDEKLLRQIIKLFNKKNCTSNSVYVDAVKKIHSIAPTAQTAFYMGVNSYMEKDYTQSVKYLEEALSLYTKKSDTINTYLMIGQNYMQMHQYSTAREYAYKVLRMNPSNAKAYILIGDLYAYSGTSTDIPGAANWAAADKYSKAMSIAASLKDNDEKQMKIYQQAQQGLSNASAHFPKTETYFQRGFQKGQSYRVEGWINEVTTVR